MSKIALTPNATGTGTFTISSPATNTNRTLTLPDEAGTVLTSASSLASANLTGAVTVSGGNVGIGTSSPDTPLEIQIGSSGNALKLSSSTDGVAVYLAFEQQESGTKHVRGRVRAASNGADGGLIIETGSSGSMSERMRIDSSGNLLVGKTSVGVSGVGAELRNGASDYAVTGVSSSSAAALFGRNSNDGDIILFRQDNTTEGTISVSGTTVSYNGGHLARWSQLADNTRDDTLLKGTVLTNLDQMASWLVDAVEATYYTEDDELPDGVSVGDEKTPAVAEHYQDNEQLNCMAKSSVEGDPNVAGVFVNWDNDDDEYTNDMNIAMTGDMIIRIAQGTTVSRGDLLMSAGDGTAKPQGDDIVRSKTIAKVTSTHVTCTYDDGSYCVPCVLMAC
jgi:hypothetical protein